MTPGPVQPLLPIGGHPPRGPQIFSHLSARYPSAPFRERLPDTPCMSLAGPLAASAPPDDGVADAAVFGPPYAPRPAEGWALENCPRCGCGQLLAQSRKGGCWNCGLRACGLRAGQ